MLTQQSSSRVAHRYRPPCECSTVKPAETNAGQQNCAPGEIARALLFDVRVVVECGHHRSLHRRGHDHASVLANLEQLGDQLTVARDEAGPVARKVRAFRQRVHGEQSRM